MHHLRFPFGRAADVRDAAGIRRSATRQRALFNVASSSEDIAESTAIPRLCARGGGWRIGTLFQTTIIGNCRFSIFDCQLPIANLKAANTGKRSTSHGNRQSKIENRKLPKEI